MANKIDMLPAMLTLCNKLTVKVGQLSDYPNANELSNIVGVLDDLYDIAKKMGDDSDVLKELKPLLNNLIQLIRENLGAVEDGNKPNPLMANIIERQNKEIIVTYADGAKGIQDIVHKIETIIHE